MREVYISVDIEASGPIPATYSMLSLGAVAVHDLKATFYVELQPINDEYVLEAMKVVGRTLQDFWQAGREPKTAMTMFRKWVKSVASDGKPIFVGFNATFDWAFVNYYFYQYLGENPFGIGGIDIKSYYMGLSGCKWDDTRSRCIQQQFKGSTQPHTHNALDDAIEQAEYFRRMHQSAARSSGG